MLNYIFRLYGFMVGGAETKQTIITGKNGAKTVVHQTEEKFEETDN